MGKLTGTATAAIAAPLERCFAIAADVDRIAEWQKGVVAVDVRERDPAGRALEAQIVNDAKVRQITVRVRFVYDEPRGLSWRQESGDLKALAGSWRFADGPGDTVTATYALEIDPGRMLGMLARGQVEERVRATLVNGRPGELKARAERSWTTH